MALIKRTSPCLCDSSHICLSALCRTSLVYLTHHGVVTLNLRQRSAVTGLTVSLMNGTEAYPGIGAYGWAKFVSSHCSFLRIVRFWLNVILQRDVQFYFVHTFEVPASDWADLFCPLMFLLSVRLKSLRTKSKTSV